MKLDEIKTRTVNTGTATNAAKEVIYDALEELSKDVGIIAKLKPFWKSVKVNSPKGQDNLVTVVFKLNDQMAPGTMYSPGYIGKRDADKEVNMMKNVADELVHHLMNDIGLEDYNIDGNKLFMVANDFHDRDGSFFEAEQVDVEEGIFAPKPQGRNPQDKRKRTQNYSVLAQAYKIEISLKDDGVTWGVSWVDPETGKEGYEERNTSQIVSLDQLVDFAVEEANWKG